MKNNFLYIVGSASLLLSSCDSYLDVEPKTFFTTETFYTQPEHAQQAVSACYDLLHRPYRGVATYGESPFFMLEFATGMCETSVGQASYSAEFREANASEDNLYAWDWWQSYYQGIENCNIALSKLPGVPGVSPSEISQFMGEVYFLRAYYYFILVQLYGDIPLKIVPTESAENVNMPRTPLAEVYKQIESDLLEAEKTSLPTTSTSGKVTKGAVKSLLSKVYLTMAGYPLQNKEMYAKAATKAKEVIDNGWYDLFLTLDDLRSSKNRNNVEHVFSTQFAIGIAEHALQDWLLPRYSRISNFSNEYGCFYPDSAFIRTYDPSDKRVQEKGFFYTNHPSVDDPNKIVEFPAHLYKFFDEEAMAHLSLRKSNSFSLYR